MREVDDKGHPYPVIRMTAQRRAIAKAVEAMPGAFTADDLLMRLSSSRSARATETETPSAGRSSVATIYRTLSAMEASSYVERVGERDGRALFALCGAADHHHHIVCDGCGRIAHAECPVVSVPQSSRTDGFVVTRHEVTLYGLCPDCRRPAEDG
jgi:Fe2+ or Zn2+ uptake regulation protein